MDRRLLPPEAVVDLKIHLDRMRRTQDQCHRALSDVAEGRLSRDAYLELMEHSVRAERAWEERHQRYFGSDAPQRRASIAPVLNEP